MIVVDLMTALVQFLFWEQRWEEMRKEDEEGVKQADMIDWLGWAFIAMW